MNKKDKKICRIYTLNDGEKNFVRNFKIVEWNMDKVLNYWYAKDEVNIQKFKYLIMLDLNEEDLAKLSNDRKVMKFMNEVKKVNEDPEFFSYMTKEEDEEKCHNTELKEATEAGKKERNIEVAKNMLLENISLNIIQKVTELSEEEIKKITASVA